MKDKITGGVDIVWCILMTRKLKLKSQDPKKHNCWTFSEKYTKNDVFRSCDFILAFLNFSPKCAGKSNLPAILFFMKFCVARTFFGRTSPRWCSWGSHRGSPGGWIKLIDKYHRNIRWKNVYLLFYKIWRRYLTFWAKDQLGKLGSGLRGHVPLKSRVFL